MYCRNAGVLCHRARRFFVTLIAAIALLTFCGCGDSTDSMSINQLLINQLLINQLRSNQLRSTLAVPDTGNNRVLIYNQPFTNGESASLVLGQTDFVTATSATSPTGMYDPCATAMDGSGNLYVLESDMFLGSGNRRVIQFVPPFTTGMAATLAIGASDLATAGTEQPNGLAIDPSGNLWVSYSSGTILKFTPPFSTGMAPALTLTPVTLGGLVFPKGLAFDGSGNLWVADSGNNRVLEFSAPISAASTPALELGQPDFTATGANTGGISAATLNGPAGIAFDASGHVWVADSGNHRVLRYTAPSTNGTAADLVVGQADFTFNTANRGGAAGAATLNFPCGISFINDKLVVGDSNNNRTLIYPSPFTNGMSASNVLGQADFTTTSANAGGAAPTAATQNTPFYNGGYSLLAVAVFAVLVAGWFAMNRRRRRVSE